MTGKQLQASDLLNLLRRPKEILIPFVLITLASATVVYMLPNHYRSDTLIMVVPQRLPENYVRSTVTTRIEDRLRSLNQQITSRSRLEPLITELHLYPQDAGRVPMEDIVDRMRTDIRTDIMRSDAFRISYTSKDPKTALVVTQRLASMYLDESLREREATADSTNEFLDSQLSEAKTKLEEQEQKVETYRRQYAGQLPAQVQANLQVMQNAQLQIQALIDSANRDRDRLQTLQRELAGLSDPVVEPAPRPVVPPAAQELAQAVATLDELRLRLLDTHPDVVRQQRLVADLRKKAADEASAARDAAREPPPPPAAPPASKRATIAELEGEIAALTRRIDDKSVEEVHLRAVVADYQARVASAPARESELSQLMRDSETIEHSYTSLLARKDDAQVSANMERRQIGEQFKVLDPARMPETPVSPRRLPLYAAGAALGLVAGLTLAGFLEFRDTSLKTDADVVAALTLPVLAMIPEIPNPGRRRGRLRSVALHGR